ncbi:hypothetical protein AVEN_212839-1 [Araneus ventricosus]|uniref:Uncharacterized protein n=1 Tax=Araneus ventricosus TaxID=182803 RepID=A0A4Y2Q6L9_ARAVE|nr:hypothetical protein AVEN_212839-1 [Araneus ventricosus]
MSKCPSQTDLYMHYPLPHPLTQWKPHLKTPEISSGKTLGSVVAIKAVVIRKLVQSIMSFQMWFPLTDGRGVRGVRKIDVGWTFGRRKKVGIVLGQKHNGHDFFMRDVVTQKYRTVLPRLLPCLYPR